MVEKRSNNTSKVKLRRLVDIYGEQAYGDQNDMLAKRWDDLKFRAFPERRPAKQKGSFNIKAKDFAENSSECETKVALSALPQLFVYFSRSALALLRRSGMLNSYYSVSRLDTDRGIRLIYKQSSDHVLSNGEVCSRISSPREPRLSITCLRTLLRLNLPVFGQTTCLSFKMRENGFCIDIPYEVNELRLRGSYRHDYFDIESGLWVPNQWFMMHKALGNNLTADEIIHEWTLKFIRAKGDMSSKELFEILGKWRQSSNNSIYYLMVLNKLKEFRYLTDKQVLDAQVGQLFSKKTKSDQKPAAPAITETNPPDTADFSKLEKQLDNLAKRIDETYTTLRDLVAEQAYQMGLMQGISTRLNELLVAKQTQSDVTTVLDEKTQQVKTWVVESFKSLLASSAPPILSEAILLLMLANKDGYALKDVDRLTQAIETLIAEGQVVDKTTSESSNRVFEYVG